jgi:hypothetical protein
MVTKLHIITNESIELDDFCDHIEQNFDLSDRQQFLAAAPALRKLANNKELFRRAALQTLKAALDPDGFNIAPAYMILNDHRPSKFTVRANLWPALRPGAWQETRDIFSYDLKHDHTFTFLTANYFGPGYTTKVWVNPHAGLQAMKIGDIADLQYQGEFQLCDDTLLFFERFTDVHIQLPPVADSVSLNLVLRDPEETMYPQHAFETDSGKVVAYPNGSPLKNKLIFARLLATSDDPELADVLDWAAHKETSRVHREALLSAKDQILARAA